MSDNTIEITICLGSSCFARGNRKTVALIQEYIKKNHLEKLIIFNGNHCFGKCNKGPVLKVNDKIYEGVDEKAAISIIEKEIAHLKST